MYVTKRQVHKMHVFKIFITAIVVFFNKLKQIIQIEYKIRIPRGGSGMEWLEQRDDRGIVLELTALGACKSHNKPVKRHICRPVYF